MSRIINLKVSNIKILKVIDITPVGNTIEIRGKNEHGKTSLLDTIWWGLGGSKNIDEKPVREGESKAFIRIELDDLIITRNFIQKEGQKYTTSLTVRNKEGMKYQSPQQILDKLISSLNFDPLKFLNMKPREQFEELRKILKIDFDFDAHEKERLEIYNERTLVNRDVVKVEGAIAKIAYPEDTPDEEVNIKKLSNILENSLRINSEITSSNKKIKGKEDFILSKKRGIELLKTEILLLEKEIEEEREFSKDLTFYEEDKLQKIRVDINNSTEVNNNVSCKNRKLEMIQELEAIQSISTVLTNKIKDLDELKAKKISEVEMPIDKLELGNYEIIYDGKPFAQANSATKLKVSCAIIMNTDNKLRVIRIENGSLLDKDNLETLKNMAIKYDYQVWIEIVDDSGEVGVVIENGEIKKIN